MRNPFNDSAIYAPTDDEPTTHSAFGWVGLAFVAVLAVALSLQFALELSAFAFLVGKAVLALGLFVFIDKHIFHRWDTYEELKEGNTAVGLYFLGVCVLLAAAVMSS